MSFRDSLWHSTAGDTLDPAVARCPETSTWTWPSSARDTPDSGPPTTCTASILDADRNRGARDRGVRRFRPQRGLVLRAVPARVERHRAPARRRRRRRDAPGDARGGGGGGTGRGRRGPRHPLRPRRHDSARAQPGAAHARARARGGRARASPATWRGSSCSPRRRPRTMRAAAGARRHVHPALRGDAPAAPRPGPRIARGGARRLDLRATTAAEISPARCHRPRHGARRVVVRATEGYTPSLRGDRRG